MTDEKSEMLRPPVNRAMRVLDRGFFQKTVPISAARVASNQHISQCRRELEKSKDMLDPGTHEVRTIVSDPTPELAQQGRKCILLREGIASSGKSSPRTRPAHQY
jgi:tRNA (guanine37-N1)-methyltransferase